MELDLVLGLRLGRVQDLYRRTVQVLILVLAVCFAVLALVPVGTREDLVQPVWWHQVGEQQQMGCWIP